MQVVPAAPDPAPACGSVDGPPWHLSREELQRDAEMIGRRGTGQDNGARPPLLDRPAHPGELIRRDLDPWEQCPISEGPLDRKASRLLGTIIMNDVLNDSAGPVR